MIERPARHDLAAVMDQARLPAILASVAVFVVIWAAFYTLTEGPLSIKHDMSEAYAWGQEFQLGYHQHPPFWAWICGLWFLVFPATDWAFALLSSLNAGIGLWGAWVLIGDFASGRRRVTAWALLLLTPLYTFYAYKYNANIIFLSIWPWTLHYFMRCVRGRDIGDAVAFGVCVGIALMSKYYALILLATCLLALLQHPARWPYLGSASPYVSAAVAAVLCAPHAWWLLTNQAPPVQYLADVSGQGWHQVFGYVTRTLSGAAVMNAGVAAIVAFAAWRWRRDRATGEAGDVSRGMLATLALAPLVLTLAGAIVLRTSITPEMTIGTFPLLPLLLIDIVGLGDDRRLCWLSTRLAVALTLGAFLASPVLGWWRTYVSPGMKALPYEEIAIAATRLWHDRTSLPLLYVGGSDWYENAISFYSPDHPHAFVHFDYAHNLWVTPEAIARHGLLSVCVSGDTICLAATEPFVTPDTTRTELSVAREHWGHVARPVQFIMTIIPPRQ